MKLEVLIVSSIGWGDWREESWFNGVKIHTANDNIPKIQGSTATLSFKELGR